MTSRDELVMCVTFPATLPTEGWCVMASMFVVVGLLSAMFMVALVLAAVADRRRSIAVDADASRFAPPALNPKLPWA